jgi:hypothetical protein
MSGHLFITQGDLTRLACDAWLLPTSKTLWVEDSWLRSAPGQLKNKARTLGPNHPGLRPNRIVQVFETALSPEMGWYTGEERTFDWTDWKTDNGQNRPWLTRMAIDDWRPISEKADWYAEGARQFVEGAAKKSNRNETRLKRERPLLAVPIVGTGEGGGSQEAGVILRRLIGELYRVLERVDADIVLVAHRNDQLAAAQHVRRDVLADLRLRDGWGALPARLKEVAEKVAREARNGNLVLFLGAGVSIGAGLPDWKALLNRLASTIGLTGPAGDELQQLPEVDQARILRDRARTANVSDAAPGFADLVSELVEADRYSLSHSLLAGLNVSQVVTTNYDVLFETASVDSGFPTAVLPYESPKNVKRWILKMHGCVKHADDIVLTREDYLRYGERRAALAGIVQAMLITRHMLFVGFSLSDDNFHRIVDDVRKVVHRPAADDQAPAQTRFGTALMLDPSSLVSELWGEDLDCVALADDRPQGTLSNDQWAERSSIAARRLEIMLDYVAYVANQNVSHLLDGRYAGLLSELESELRDRVLQLQAGAPDAMKQLPAWKPVEEMLESLGGSTPEGAEMPTTWDELENYS